MFGSVTLARNESHLERNEMRLERKETRLERNETCLARNETRLARNDTRGGNLHLSGTVELGDKKKSPFSIYTNKALKCVSTLVVRVTLRLSDKR